VKYRGQSHPIHGVNLQELMPNTLHFMTYEGSATYPGCWETVTWILLNKPIYITAQDLFGLRLLMQGDEVNPKAPLARNSRSYFFYFFYFPSKATTLYPVGIRSHDP
jgi:carbonic anhydrase